MEYFWSFTVSILASVVFAIGMTIFTMLHSRSHYRSIWKFRLSKGAKVFLVTGTFDNPLLPLGYRHANTAVSDAVALGHISHSLALGYRERYLISPICSSSFSESMWSSPLVLIGGRVRNSATRYILDKLEDTREVRLFIEDTKHTETRYVFDYKTGVKYEATINEERITTDFGVVYRFINPIRPHDPNPVFVFYGLHAHGTFGVAKFLSPEYKKSLSALGKSLNGIKEFQILVKIEVTNEEVFPHVIGVYPIL